MGKPFVSVLIDTYNHERFIEQAIVSVIEQEFPASDREILVVDDGSTDRTPEIVRKFEPQVRLLRKANGGQASAFNVGIPECKGEIVAFLDGDDWWAKGKLNAITNYLSSSPKIGVVGHGFCEFDTTTTRVLTTTPKDVREIDFSTESGGSFFRQMMCFFGTSRVAIRRDVLLKALPIPQGLVVEADEFMSTMSIAYSSAALIPLPLTFYRLHPENLFQVRSHDQQKLRRIQQVVGILARQLRVRLAEAAIDAKVIAAIVDPLDVNAKRLRLTLDGGKPWETFQTERAEFHFSYKETRLAYRVFKALVLALTLFLPPRTFYRIRRSYGASRWRELRRVLGEPVPTAEIANAPLAGSCERNEQALRT